MMGNGSSKKMVQLNLSIPISHQMVPQRTMNRAQNLRLKKDESQK